MRMVVAENVILTKPLADGRDYEAGEVIELDAAVAEAWKRRGWLIDYVPPMMPRTSAPKPLMKTEGRRG